MKVSLNWLKEFVDIKITPEELANRMALSFVEVDEIIKFDEIYKDVVVGEIKEIKKHPNADNLSVAKVSIGKKKIQIIIGQGLILAVGTKFPVVIAPAELPSGMVVEKRAIRGVESEGMIGANKELGLDWLQGDITFFDKKIKTGTPISKAMGLGDAILDLDILSNRPDLFSHLGVSREISAVTGLKLKKYNWGELKEDSKIKVDTLLDVEIRDKKLCPRYEARVLENVKIKESPDWLKNRLSALGIRPINNIVDITNYVMIETGQPMHAFDFATLTGVKKKSIVVRRAKSGEEIITLDDKKRRLTKDSLIITDGKKAIGIAGVMGGKETEVTEKTKTIILEAANFSWPSIRKTSRLLGLRSEAVNRFEKGLDPNITSLALDRAAYLISSLAEGKIAIGKIDEKYTNYADKKIQVSLNKIEKILGFSVKSLEVKKSLESLGMTVEIKGDFIDLIVPSYRMDIKEDVDIIEDVARIIGYDKVPSSVPKGGLIPPKQNDDVEKELFIKNTLVGLGLAEVYTYSFIGEELIRTFGDSVNKYLELKNPLSPDRAYLRKNLVYSLAECAIENAKNFDELSIFEI
ncbi:phenylalanine--tRNA ligase subunit beta, partial [bacterium]|nr:phenylalanine--tRNA ligase subunit beta [bacterium]